MDASVDPSADPIADANVGPLTYAPLGDRTAVVRFRQHISADVNEAVHAAAERIREAGMPGLLDIVPTMASLAVTYDPFRITFDELVVRLKELRLDAARPRPRSGTSLRVPVCYGGAFGPDLDRVAEEKGLHPDEVVRLHSGKTYLVYMLGFIAGYPYIGDLDPRLSMPRRTSPRLSVEKGSVVIADRLTVINPVASPGGWHIIGRTPIDLFDPAADPPCAILAGDRVTFEPIDEPAFRHWNAEARKRWTARWEA